MREFFLGLIFGAIVFAAFMIDHTLRGPPLTADQRCYGTSIVGHVGMIPVNLCMRSTP